MTFDYTSMGFITFDALCRPVDELPAGGNTFFVEDFALAISGAAGAAAVVAAKHGLSVQVVGGVGEAAVLQEAARYAREFNLVHLPAKTIGRVSNQCAPLAWRARRGREGGL